MTDFWDLVADVVAFVLLGLGVVFVIAAVIAGVLFGIAQPLLELSCNQRADQLRVVDGDYRVWSDTCWLTLEDGSTIPADQYRVVQQKEVSE